MMVPFMAAYWWTVFFSVWIPGTVFIVGTFSSGRRRRNLMVSGVVLAGLWGLALFLGLWLPVFIPGLY